MKLRYDLNSMTPGILVSPRADPGVTTHESRCHPAQSVVTDSCVTTPGSVPSSQIVVTNQRKVDGHADLTLTGGLNSFTLRGSVTTIRALLTEAIVVLDQVQADGITRFKIKEI